MAREQGAKSSKRKGRPPDGIDLHIAFHFAQNVDRGFSSRQIAKEGMKFLPLSLGSEGRIITRDVQKLEGDALARRQRLITRNIRESEAAVALHVAANARTTWGAPLHFPSGFLPENQPKAGRPPKKRRR